MSDIIIKDIKRKTTIPEEVIVRAARVANGLPVSSLAKKADKKKNTLQLQKTH